MKTKRNSPRDKFTFQHGMARKRKIPFLLTFEEWWDIWQKSGHWHERGRKKGQYVMARKGDVGPYAIGNVEIMFAEQNTHDGHFGKKLSDEHCAKISKSRKGIKFTPEHCKNISISGRGRTFKQKKPYSPERRQKIREFRTGTRWTNEQRRKMSSNWHQKRGLIAPPTRQKQQCRCGCGKMTNPGRQFIHGHNRKGLEIRRKKY